MEPTNLPNEGRANPNDEIVQPVPLDTAGEPPAVAPNWNFGASVNPPPRAAPPVPLPHEFIARLTSTAAARSQALRICSAAEVAADIGPELTRILAAFQTPEAIIACAGENIPALKDYCFQVIKSTTAIAEGNNSGMTLAVKGGSAEPKASNPEVRKAISKSRATHMLIMMLLMRLQLLCSTAYVLWGLGSQSMIFPTP